MSAVLAKKKIGSVGVGEEFESEMEEGLYNELHARYGMMIGGAELRKFLGFKTPDAFRKAVERGTVTLPTFSFPGRRSRFALTREIARWIAQARGNANTATPVAGTDSANEG